MIKLTELRVVAGMDAGGYAQGAKTVTDSNRAMVNAMAMVDAETQNVERGLTRMSRAFIPGYTEANRLYREMLSLEGLLERGKVAPDRAGVMYEGMAQKFGLVADAATMARAEFALLAPVVDRVNASMAARGGVPSMPGGGPSSDAVREQQRMAAAAAELKRQVDPLGAAYDRLNAEIAEYNALLAAGAINQQLHTGGVALANAKYAEFNAMQKHVGTGLRLRQHELSNITYQLNDMAVMLASGQAPFMILMQQGMQLAQPLGPHGLVGGVKALGAGMMTFLTNPINLAVLGFAGLAAGATYAYKQIMSGGFDIEKSLERQKDLLSDIRDAYKDVGYEVGQVASGSIAALRLRVEIDVEKSRKEVAEQIQSMLSDIMPRPAGGKGGAVILNAENLPFADAMRDLNSAVKSGRGDIDGFLDRIAEIAASTADEKVQKTAAEIAGMSDEFALLQRQAEAAKRSLDPLASKLFEMFSKPRQMLGEERENTPLYDFLPELRSQQQMLRDSYDELYKKAAGTADGAAIMAEAVRVMGDATAYLNSETSKLVALNNVEIAQIYAKSPADKARLAAEQERISLINTATDATEAEIRVQHAYSLALQQANFQIAEQNRERMRAANDNLTMASLDVAVAGQPAWEQERLRNNLKLRLDLEKEAAENGVAFNRALYNSLVAVNNETAKQNALLAATNLELALADERKMLFMPSNEADIFKRLKSADIEEGTAAWAKLADQLREIQEIESSFGHGFARAFDDIARDAADFASSAKDIVDDLYGGLEDVWVNFAKTGKLSFSSLIDSMIEDISRLTYKMAMDGLFDIFSMSGGGSILNFLANGYGGLYAKGGVFSGGHEVDYFARGGIVSSPTMFPMAGGRRGMMGEAGPEGIFPLRRGADGRLGVEAAGGGGGNVVVNLSSVVNMNGSGGNDNRRDIERALDARDKRLMAAVPRAVMDARRRSKAGF